MFASRRDGDFELYTQHVGQDDLKRLTENNVPDYDPSWSTVNDRIAFVSGRDGTRDIWTMNPDGEGLDAAHRRRGPGGRPRVVARRVEDRVRQRSRGRNVLHLRDERRRQRRRATRVRFRRRARPDVVADGRFIAFARADDPSVVAIVDVETGESVGTLAEAGAAAGFPAWQVP